MYGGNKEIPFSVHDRTDRPISIYAASKKANELMAATYSHLYGLNTTGLSFLQFTGLGVGQIWPCIFTEKIMKEKPIPLFNKGVMKRDFTYIDDIVNGIISSIEKNYHSEIFNLGNNKSEDLMDVVKIIEKELDKKAMLNLLGMQPGDVTKTFANIDYTVKKLNYKPETTIYEGIPNFINWYKQYKINFNYSNYF